MEVAAVIPNAYILIFTSFPCKPLTAASAKAVAVAVVWLLIPTLCSPITAWMPLCAASCTRCLF